MKKLTVSFVFAAALSFAGPLKVATFPVVHPVKTAKAVKTAAKGVTVGMFKAVKAVVW